MISVILIFNGKETMEYSENSGRATYPLTFELNLVPEVLDSTVPRRCIRASYRR